MLANGDSEEAKKLEATVLLPTNPTAIFTQKSKTTAPPFFFTLPHLRRLLPDTAMPTSVVCNGLHERCRNACIFLNGRRRMKKH